MVNKTEEGYIKNLKLGPISAKFAIFGVEAKLTKNGEKYLYLKLGDKTGVLTALYFTRDGKEIDENISNYRVGQVVMVKGVVEKYKDNLNIKVSSPLTNSLIPLGESEFNMSDFKLVTKNDTNEMINYIKNFIKNLENQYLKQLCELFFDDEKFVKEFSNAPGAQSKHHNYVGGLLEHTVEVMKICDLLCDFHEELNRELLLCGALFHDMGKLKSYNYNGASIERTERENLIGHIVLGSKLLVDKINGIEDFPEDLRLKLSHLILSHHGEIKQAFGSAVGPKLPEAYVLHYADYLSSQAKIAVQNIVDTRD